MTRAFQKAWLKVTAVVIGSFAPVCFLGTMELTAAPARLTLDILRWRPFGTTTYASPDTRLLSALMGGFLLGWGIMVWRLSGKAFDQAPEEVRTAVLMGLIGWFCLDTAGSIASSNPSNVAFNVPILLLAVGPLWWSARA